MRKAIVEPVFGRFKERRGLRRFSLRGLDDVRSEWRLVCLTGNLLKLFRSGWAPQAARKPEWKSFPLLTGLAERNPSCATWQGPVHDRRGPLHLMANCSGGNIKFRW